MAVPEVVLVLDKKSRVVLRQGQLLDLHGSRGTVEWADGPTEDVQFGATEDQLLIRMPAGGLRHRKHIDAKGASELVRSAPAQAFVLALLDSSRPMSSRDLIAQLENNFDVDARALWKHAREAFEEDEHVDRSGKGPSLKYSWVGDPDPYVARTDLVGQQTDNPELSGGAQSSASDTPLTSAGQPDNTSTEPAPVDDSAPVGSVASPSDAEASVPTQPSADGHVNPAVELVESTSTFGHLPDDWTRLLTRSLRAPLAAGRSVESVPEAALSAAVPMLDKAVVVLLALPRSSKALKSIDAVALTGPEGARALLASANAEVRASEPGTEHARELQRAQGFLVRRILASPSVALLGPDTVLRAARDLEAAGEASRGVELIAEALARVIDSTSPDAWRQLPLQTKSAIARRLVPAALQPNSPRARVLTWIWRNDPAELGMAMWWRAVDFDDLAAVATTPLAAALESDVIASMVVKPLVTNKLESATTRRHLLTALAAPAALARLMSDDMVQRAFERAMREDTIGRAWLVGLRNEARIAQLLRQVEALTLEAQESERRATHAWALAQDAEDRLLRAEERLSEAAAATSDLRESQSRQIKIDAMRALASLCAYVDGALGSQNPERIRGRVRQMATREGLVPIGAAGEATPYDPRKHDVIGEVPQPGSTVTVTGVGYTWGEGADEIVLVRALVERSV